MIAKVLAPNGKASFRNLRQYIGADEKTHELWLGNLDSGRAPEAQMEATAAENPYCDGPIFHFMVSWRPGETPTDGAMRRTVEDAVNALGLREHQWMAARHHDAQAAHVHVVVNRISPITLKAVAPQRPIDRLANVCRELERAYGFERPPRSATIDWSAGVPILVGSSTIPLKRRTRDSEIWSGQLSIVRWAQMHATTEILNVLSQPGVTWQDVHTAFGRYGLRYELRSHADKCGGILVDRTTAREYRAMPSDVHESFGLQQLEARLGAFEPADQHTPTRLEKAYGPARARRALPIPEVQHPAVYSLFLEHRLLREQWEDGTLKQHYRQLRRELGQRHAREHDAIDATVKRLKRSAAKAGPVERQQTEASIGRIRSEGREQRRQDRLRLQSLIPAAHFRDWLKQQAAAKNAKAEAALLCLRKMRDEAEVVLNDASELERWYGVSTMNDQPPKTVTLTIQQIRHRLDSFAQTAVVNLQSPVQIEDSERILRSARIAWAQQKLIEASAATTELTLSLADENAADALLEALEDRFGVCEVSVSIDETLRLLDAEDLRYEQRLAAVNRATEASPDNPSGAATSNPLEPLKRTLQQIRSGIGDLIFLTDENQRIPLPYAGKTSRVNLPELSKQIQQLVAAREAEPTLDQEHVAAGGIHGAATTSQTQSNAPTENVASSSRRTVDEEARKHAHQAFLQYLTTTGADRLWQRFYERYSDADETIHKHLRETIAQMQEAKVVDKQRYTKAAAEALRARADLLEASLIEIAVTAQFATNAVRPMKFQEWLRSRIDAGEKRYQAVLDSDWDLGADEREVGIGRDHATLRNRLLQNRGDLFAKSLRWEDREGVVYYSFGTTPAFSDNGDSISLFKNGLQWDERSIVVALQIAMARHGGVVEVTGPPGFQRRAMQVAVKYNLHTAITNKELEPLKTRLVSSKANTPPTLPEIPIDPTLAERLQNAYRSKNVETETKSVIEAALVKQVREYLAIASFTNDTRLPSPITGALPKTDLAELPCMVHTQKDGPAYGTLLTTIMAPNDLAYAVVRQGRTNNGRPDSLALIPITRQQCATWRAESGMSIAAIPGRDNTTFSLELREQLREVEGRTLGYER
jgi:hypothetical protein